MSGLRDILAWRYVLPPPEPPLAFVTPQPSPVRPRHCEPCDVTWYGGPECWCCGQAVT